MFTEENHIVPFPGELDYTDEWFDAAAMAESAAPAAGFLPRSKKLWVPFLIPVALCGISFLCGGVQVLSDLGFLTLTIICLVNVILEVKAFPQRMGVGGILVFGGVLVWFCYDYLVTWFGVDNSALPMGDMTETLGKQTFFYCLFVIFLVVGLNLPPWQRLEQRLASIPEPATPKTYFIVFLLMECVGFSSFLFSLDSLPVTIMKVAFGPWLHESVQMTVFRTGNYNTSWGAYVTQMMEIGITGSVIGIAYAIFVARDSFTRAVAWLVWVFWSLQAYGGGRRGQLALVVMPALAFLYLRYQLRVLSFGKKHSIKGLLVVGLLALLFLLVVQIQGKFRNSGLGDEVDLSRADMTSLEGNRMFSEALPGFRVVPDQVTFFCNSFPGEGAIRAMPDTLFWFILGPIPRALWPNKPSDDAMIWYNKLVAGTDGKEGTTIAQGLVGHWYFRYGMAGVVEGALLVGWLMGVSERLLRAANGRPTTILTALSLAVWLFRIYRNFYFIEFYGPAIGIGTFIIIGRIVGSFGREPAPNLVQDNSYG